MEFAMHATKLVVRDVAAQEQFYLALGMKLVNRNLGGDKEVHQQQSWLSASGEASPHILILSQFLEMPVPRPPVYPGEIWLCFQVPDVDETCRTVESLGGKVLREGENRPEHSVRAAVVTDPEGHCIELVGPMLGA